MHIMCSLYCLKSRLWCSNMAYLIWCHPIFPSLYTSWTLCKMKLYLSLACWGSYYINITWRLSSIGASAQLTVPSVPALFCPRHQSWVMDLAKPDNAWCNCQRTLIIRTLHVGLFCSTVFSSLTGNFEFAWAYGKLCPSSHRINTYLPLHLKAWKDSTETKLANSRKKWSMVT